MNFTGFWFRCPDELDTLLALPPAQLKVFLVVMRAQQRDANGGKLSLRQIAQRAGLSYNHTQAAAHARIQRGGVYGRMGRTGLRFLVELGSRRAGNVSAEDNQTTVRSGVSCAHKWAPHEHPWAAKPAAAPITPYREPAFRRQTELKK